MYTRVKRAIRKTGGVGGRAYMMVAPHPPNWVSSEGYQLIEDPSKVDELQGLMTASINKKYIYRIGWVD